MQRSKFDPHKHHRRSIRLKGYDYSQSGAYFITICTYQRLPLFGEIVDAGMQMNFVGRISRKEWERLPGRFPFLEIGSFVVMPNHIHAILIMGRGTAGHDEAIVSENSRRAPTGMAIEYFRRPVAGSLPTIVRSYKSAVSLRVNRLRQRPNHPLWQRNYYEHVIRDQVEWEHIEAYIQANPKLWDTDQINPFRLA
jgi:putative transposase